MLHGNRAVAFEEVERHVIFELNDRMRSTNDATQRCSEA
jgi:hypothetical protein